jgi:hypothetical protein
MGMAMPLFSELKLLGHPFFKPFLEKTLLLSVRPQSVSNVDANQLSQTMIDRIENDPYGDADDGDSHYP